MVDKQKVIELAKQAGVYSAHSEWTITASETFITTHESINAFAQLVRDDRDAELLAGSGEPVAWMNPRGGMLLSNYVNTYATGLEKETHTIPLHTADQQASAVLREREECAKECERMVLFPGGRQEASAHSSVWDAAKAIRARG